MNVSKRLIGIGGSALGPQSVAHALGHPLRDKLRTCFFDNTDHDGTHRIYMVGNKVATYKYSYSQQLRYRLNNFFVAFVSAFMVIIWEQKSITLTIRDRRSELECLLPCSSGLWATVRHSNISV